MAAAELTTKDTEQAKIERWRAGELERAGYEASAAALLAGTCTDEGTAQFLGTEINLGFQWRFVANVALDVVGSYMFAGNALATHLATNVASGVAQSGRNPQDITAVTARVRYTW